jgi:hypothetical protein
MLGGFIKNKGFSKAHQITSRFIIQGVIGQQELIKLI